MEVFKFSQYYIQGTHTMLASLKWLALFGIIAVFAQEPRKRPNMLIYEEPMKSDEDVSCSTKTCLKRSSGQTEFGPFWANRGKKDPTYLRSKLYVEEPKWILVRRNSKNINDDEPFYVTRGKKDMEKLNENYYWDTLALRGKRDFMQTQEDAPFFAARGRKRFDKPKRNCYLPPI